MIMAHNISKQMRSLRLLDIGSENGSNMVASLQAAVDEKNKRVQVAANKESENR